VLIVLAAVLAFALSPLVALFRRRLSQPLAVAAGYLVGVAIVVGLGLLLILTAANQIVALVQNLPYYVGRIQALEPKFIEALRPFGVTGASVQNMNQQILAAAQQIGGTLATSSLGFLRTFAGSVIDAVLVLILSVYFTLDGPRLAAWLQNSTPGNIRSFSRFLVNTTSQVLGGYVRGTFTMALLVGFLVGLGLTVLGVPFALLLGVLAFFMEFVPVVGVLISGVVSLLLALPRGTTTVVLVLVYFVLVHVIESDVVGPRILGRAVGIHPATGIIALLAGSELFGIWGALFAAPLAGLLQAFITVVWQGLTTGQPGVFTPLSPERQAELLKTDDDHA
jgi:predicted PurR-regulated permease PerM